MWHIDMIAFWLLRHLVCGKKNTQENGKLKRKYTMMPICNSNFTSSSFVLHSMLFFSHLPSLTIHFFKTLPSLQWTLLPHSCCRMRRNIHARFWLPPGLPSDSWGWLTGPGIWLPPYKVISSIQGQLQIQLRSPIQLVEIIWLRSPPYQCYGFHDQECSRILTNL